MASLRGLRKTTRLLILGCCMLGALYCTAAKLIRQSDLDEKTPSYTLQAGWTVQNTAPHTLSYQPGNAQVSISSIHRIDTTLAEHIKQHKLALTRAFVNESTENNTPLFTIIDEILMHTDHGLEVCRYKALHNITKDSSPLISTYYKVSNGSDYLTVRCTGPKNRDTENTVAYEKIIHSIAFN